MKRIAFFSILLVAVTFAAAVRGGDCPRFRGPGGDGVFDETGLLKQWPEGGPKLAWSVKGLGKGFSSATVAGGTVYVTGMDGENRGYLFAFGLDGSQKWKVNYGPEMGKAGPARPGTRGSATVDGKRIFVMSSFGKIVTVDAAMGQVLGTVDLLELFGAKRATFGFAESVLVDGGKIICTPGGPDASLAALNKNTGETLWQTNGLSMPTGYCSPRLIRHGSQRLILTMLEKALVAVDPDTGKLLWQHEYPQRYNVQPNPPLSTDGMIYICSGARAGGQMLELADDGLSVTPKWSDKTLDCQMHGTVLIDGYIYGTAQSTPSLVCLELKTGKVMWTTTDTGRGVVVSADGMLYVYSEKGEVHLVKPDPNAFVQVGQFTVTEGSEEHWAHPTIAGGRLYVRHGDALMVYNIKAG